MWAHDIDFQMYALDDEEKDFVELMATRAGEVLRNKIKQLTNDGQCLSCGYYILWSDGFTNHHVKTTKASVGSFTATVCPPGGNANSEFYMYLLAIGPGNNIDNCQVLDRYTEEL